MTVSSETTTRTSTIDRISEGVVPVKRTDIDGSKVEEVTAGQKVAAGMEQVEGAGMVPVPETMAGGAMATGLTAVKAAKAEVRTAAAGQVAAEVGNVAWAE